MKEHLAGVTRACNIGVKMMISFSASAPDRWMRARVCILWSAICLVLLIGVVRPSRPDAIVGARVDSEMYTVQLIPNMGEPECINNSGMIVGDASGAAYIWADGKGKMLSDNLKGTAYAVNKSGTVVGDMGLGRWAFIYRDGTLSYIPEPAIGAYGINDSNEVLCHWRDQDGDVQGAVWKDGKFRALISPGSRWKYLGSSAINNRGEVAGTAMDGFGRKRAVIFGKRSVRSLGILPGYRKSGAHSLNDHGWSIGVCSDPTSAAHVPELMGFVRINKMESIPPLGGSCCYPSSINNRGQVVGSAETGAVEEYGEIEYHAFIWEGGRLTDLNKLIPRDSGWILNRGISINDRGQIVGYGNKGCFLLTPIHAK